MKIHELKTVNPHFINVQSGNKRFELIFNDRNFKKGDYLVLRHYDVTGEYYGGEDVLVRVTDILRDFPGIQDGYVILSISNPL